MIDLTNKRQCLQGVSIFYCFTPLNRKNSCADNTFKLERRGERVEESQDDDDETMTSEIHFVIEKREESDEDISFKQVQVFSSKKFVLHKFSLFTRLSALN